MGNADRLLNYCPALSALENRSGPGVRLKGGSVHSYVHWEHPLRENDKR